MLVSLCYTIKIFPDEYGLLSTRSFPKDTIFIEALLEETVKYRRGVEHTLNPVGGKRKGPILAVVSENLAL